MRTLLVGTYRHTELGLDHPLMATLAEVAREPSTQQLTLSGLSRADVSRFIQSRGDVVASETLVDAVHDQTAGNPLFVREIVALVTAGGKGGRDVAGSQSGDREALAGSQRAMPARALARIHPRTGIRCRRTRLAERPVPWRDLREPCGGHHAGSGGRGPGGTQPARFSHALVRDAIYEDMGAVERMRLHRRAGAVLASLHAHDPIPISPSWLITTCRRMSEAPARPIDYAARAARRAARLLAYEEAARLYRLALQVLPLEEPARRRHAASSCWSSARSNSARATRHGRRSRSSGPLRSPGGGIWTRR